MTRATTTAGVILGIVSVVAVLAAAQPAQGPSTVPRTPWGAPDLQGIWDYATLTPLQRPSAFAGREFLTDEEAAAFEKTSAEGWAGVRSRNRGISNDFWFDRATAVSEDQRTSLIVDPPDGRIPPLTPDATARDARTEDRPLKQRMSLAEGADGPEDRGLFERCILGPNSGPPMVPFMYTNLVQFFQTPGYVVILNEMIHDARIVPLDGRAHVHPGIAQWMGDSRGHWEDETLVVETTNFEDKASFSGNVMRRGASGETLHLVERFTRVDADTLKYEFTVDDRTWWMRPWSAEVLMQRTAGPILEFACHEGNHGMMNMLTGARRRGAACPGRRDGAFEVAAAAPA